MTTPISRSVALVGSTRREWQVWGYPEHPPFVAEPLTGVFRTEKRVREEVARLAAQSSARTIHVRFRDIDEGVWMQHRQPR